MALITSVGGASSNSFQTVEAAEERLAKFIGDTLAEQWTSCSSEQLEYRLILAAEVMSWLPWRGRRAFRNQRLCSPRDYQLDPRSIPDEVFDVHALASYEVINADVMSALVGTTTGDSPGPIRSVSLGVLSVGFGEKVVTGNVWSKAMRSSQFPMMLLLAPHLSSFRGRALRTVEERWLEEAQLLTTSS